MATTSCCGKSYLRRTENSQAARRLWTAARHWRMITVGLCRRLAGSCHHRHLWRLCLASDHAHQLAVCLSSLRSYLPFLVCLVVFLVLGCASRAEKIAAAYNLLVWDQVVQTDQLIFRTLLPLSSTLPRICVLFFLRRTHDRPITTICAMRFLAAISSAICSF